MKTKFEERRDFVLDLVFGIAIMLFHLRGAIVLTALAWGIWKYLTY